MKITINGAASEPVPSESEDAYNGIMDWINNGPIGDTTDKFIKWEVDVIFGPLFEVIADGFKALINLLNQNSVEIITLGIVICGIGMMIAPLLGSQSGKWFGRLMVVFWGGIIWRVII